ncbi:hypothetical protein [Actinomadura xylanilytica]|uniref:hypothetical protein n=1 Tax=Actinomadura xylanilytica TaxID=887459 RepID=UPI00255A7459|nr:hypothetical protein [Actinomadura xylanilytica]MDL4774441.1 hypothetical protein [Actinomadura xylanilytica]
MTRLFQQRLDRLSGLCRSLDLGVDAGTLGRLARETAVSGGTASRNTSGGAAALPGIVRVVAMPEEHTPAQIRTGVDAWVRAAVDAGLARPGEHKALAEIVVAELLIERSSLGGPGARTARRSPPGLLSETAPSGGRAVRAPSPAEPAPLPYGPAATGRVLPGPAHPAAEVARDADPACLRVARTNTIGEPGRPPVPPDQPPP